jgi:hypothetical protein
MAGLVRRPLGRGSRPRPRPRCGGAHPTGRPGARDNPIATGIVERAAAIAAGDRDALARLAVTFARLGCPYQQARTDRLVADLG